MRFIKVYAFPVFMLLLFVGLFWFSYQRNQLREADGFHIEFTHTPRFLDAISVNKMLTQNWSVKSFQEKDSLDLSMLENNLNGISEIKNAEVFMLPQGDLSVLITERIPTFKVEANPPLFGDAYGAVFPFLPIEDFQLPLFKSDVSSSSLIETASLIEEFNKDSFLKSELKTLRLDGTSYSIQLKSYPFEVILGNTASLNEKIEKLKIFCAFQNIQDSLGGYQKINLTYTNQVVATTP